MGLAEQHGTCFLGVPVIILNCWAALEHLLGEMSFNILSVEGLSALFTYWGLVVNKGI